MAQRQTLAVKGYADFQRAIRRADKETRKETRETLRESGDIVRVEWTRSLAELDAGAAAGLRTRVRTRGVAVEQSLRRTTGTRPDWGSTQMRRGVRALARKEREVVASFEQSLETICDHFDR